MQRRIRNAYKRTDVFHCDYTPHHRFEDDVSVYHVLKNRQCFPAGCVQFKWRCKQFDKGQKCPRGYKFIGRKCTGCKYYYEEKQGYASESRISAQEYSEFEQELLAWETWLHEVEDREVEFRGTIHTVKPHMKAFDGQNGGHHLKFVGWLLTFRSAIVGYDQFDDPIYVHVSREQMRRLVFAPGMEIDGLGTFRLDRGRPVLNRFHRVEVLKHDHRGSAPAETEALVAAATGQAFSPPPEKCMLCERGILVDVEGEKVRQSNPNRCLLCLEGISDPGLCLFHLKDALQGAAGPTRQAAGLEIKDGG
jgi:hypothetical protein